MEVALVVEAMADGDGDDADEAQPRKPPDVPDEREAAQRRQPGQDHARARAARHVDRLIAAQRALIAVLLHVRPRSEEHTSELQSLMRTSYAVFCLKKKKQIN